MPIPLDNLIIFVSVYQEVQSFDECNTSAS